MENESTTSPMASAPSVTKRNNSIGVLCRVALDGSKLIARFEKGVVIVIERPSKLLVGSDQLKIEYQSSKWIISSQSDKPQLAIIDACMNHRYHPIHLDIYGVVYTKEGCSHVTIGDVKQCKISNRSFPYKVCNKFVAPVANELKDAATNAERAQNEETEDLLLASNSKQVESDLVSKNFRKRLQQNEVDHTVFLKGDESITRLILSAGEKLMLHAGEILAWTIGVSFTYGKSCCSKSVTAVQAGKSGVVWIYNPYRFRPCGPVPK